MLTAGEALDPVQTPPYANEAAGFQVMIQQLVRDAAASGLRSREIAVLVVCLRLEGPYVWKVRVPHT